ncbi:TPA: hypothetical protein HA351_07915 [Methanosarcinaceae archaeon]|nr:hypothetical protein [Methanosarcinaceae archaeon]
MTEKLIRIQTKEKTYSLQILIFRLIFNFFEEVPPGKLVEELFYGLD